MGAAMCKEVSPGAGVGGRGGTLATSGGCRDSVDRAMERILRRKSQAINGTNLPSRSPALKNGSPLGSPTATGPFLFVDKGKSPPPRIAMKGPRSPPIRDTQGPFASNPTRTEESPVQSPPVRDEPPVRPPRRKDRMRRANLALPRRNQSAISLHSQAAIPEEAAARLETYLKRCHSMGTVPVLLEELRASAHVSSISTLSSSSLGSSPGDVQVPMVVADDRLPSFASVTPPPSPSSTPPEEANASPRIPHFFIGSRGRSASSSSVQDPPSPMNPYSDMWGDGSRRGASSIISSTTDGGSTRRRHLRDHGDNMQDLIRKLRRVRSHTGPERPEVHHHHHHHQERSGRSSVEPLNEHVIDILPTRAHPPNLSLNRAVSSPQIATSGPQSLLGPEADRNNPRSILLRILGEYQCLPGSGALSRSGKTGEEEELAALEKQLDARWAYIGKRTTKVVDKKKEDRKEKKEGGEEKVGKEEKDEDNDSSSSTSVTPSLGELEEALAQMLDEDDWEEREEERVNMEAEHRAKQVAEVRLKLGGEGGGSLMSLKMKRENTFTALSALSKDE